MSDKGPKPMTETEQHKRVHEIARNLYRYMPGALPVPYCTEREVPLWGEVETTDHYAFCEVIARQIVAVDTRTHIEQ